MSASATTAKAKTKKHGRASKKPYTGRIYIGRDANGKQLFQWVGRFAKKKERDEAVAAAKESRRNGGGSRSIPLCDEYVAGSLEDYEERNRESSTDIVEERLKHFGSTSPADAWTSRGKS